MAQTITEALAEIKTIGARLTAKRQFVNSILFRPEQLRDPHEKDGGSRALLLQETQSIGDLQERVVHLRRIIAQANEVTPIELAGKNRTIAEWIVWRREVVPGYQSHLNNTRELIKQTRARAQQQGVRVGEVSVAPAPGELIININERELAEEIENLETILGQLDGALSLKNATVMVDD